MTRKYKSILAASGAKWIRPVTAGLLIFASFAVVGCKTSGPLAKREAEKCCPTDIRKTVPWCAGEDALFQCPCRPNAEFYGYKPTCWGIWPSSGAAWRDAHCGDLHHGAIITDLTNQNRELIELPSLPSPAEPSETPSAEAEQGPVRKAVDKPTLRSPENPQIMPQSERSIKKSEKPSEAEEPLPEPTFGLVRLPSVEE